MYATPLGVSVMVVVTVVIGRSVSRLGYELAGAAIPRHYSIS